VTLIHPKTLIPILKTALSRLAFLLHLGNRTFLLKEIVSKVFPATGAKTQSFLTARSVYNG
jgi:hypothetical protein